MIIRQFENREDWLAWRKQGICASDVPVILGKSKWKTIDELFLEKIGETNETKDNWAMARGRNLEPTIRAKCETTYDCKLEAVCGEHPADVWARASFDGINFDRGLLFEFKTAGLGDHSTAKRGLIPDHYFPQVQWQLHVSSFSEGHYVSAHENKETGWEIEEVIVQYDPGYIDKIYPQVQRFWNCVQTKVPPSEPIASDIALAFEDYAKQWEIKARAEERMEELRRLFQDITPSDGSLSHAGFTAKWILQQGRVNYKDIPQLHGVDLDMFRGEDKATLRITRG